MRVALACLFATLSVGASIMCMSQAEEAQQVKTLYSSRAYASAKEKLKGIDADLETLRSSAREDTAHHFRDRAGRTLERIKGLSLERTEAEAALVALEQQPLQSAAAALPHALTLAGITAPLTSVNFLLELIIGSAIEIAGLLFLCGTVISGTKPRASVPEPSPPTDPVPRNARQSLHERLSMVPSLPPGSMAAPPPTVSKLEAGGPAVIAEDLTAVVEKRVAPVFRPREVAAILVWQPP